MLLRLKQSFRRRYLISQLMQIYSILLIAIITVGVIAIGSYSNYANNKNLNSQIEVMDNHLDTFIENKSTAFSFMYMELAGTHSAAENIKNYIELSPSDYFAYTEKSWDKTRIDSSVPAILSGFFNAFSDLDELYIKLDESQTYVRANRQNRKGVKMTGSFDDPKGLTLKRSIVNQYDLQPMGTIYAVFSEAATRGNLAATAEELGISTIVFDQGGSILFSQINSMDNSDKKGIYESISKQEELPDSIAKKYVIDEKKSRNDISFIILASRKKFFQKNVKEMLIIISVGVVLAGALLLTLRRTFNKYLEQVRSLVEITHSVGEGNFDERVDAGLMQEELRDLAEAINFMIDSLNQFIKDNYELEIKQRDAHMNALQAQINPHFLYNTLEYIRMYSLSLGQEELADVVFAFSALLRNNTTQEKTISLEKELSFCEKYVYLYQMRYPDQIAYQFEVEDEFKDLKIPKFSIQPLIENYFIHGIDYTRFDNAFKLSVKRDGDSILIIIKDNGKGISNDKLRQIEDKLAAKNVSMENSIGLKNVYERMKSFFGEDFDMEISSESEPAGTIISLRIR